MCRVITPDQLNYAVDFSWNLCSDMKQRSYPLFRSRSQMLQEFRWSIEHENGELVGWFEGKELRGILCYYWLPEDSYLQTTGFYIAGTGENGEARETDKNGKAGENGEPCGPDQKIADDFLSYLEHKFPDYKINIGIPAENRRAAGVLTEHGFTVTEASHDMRLIKEDFRKLPVLHKIIRIDETNFDHYAAFHDVHFQDIYWNTERLRSHINEWDIFVIRESKDIAGCIFSQTSGDSSAGNDGADSDSNDCSDYGEIFGMYAADAQSAYSLLSATLCNMFVKAPLIQEVIYFIEDHEQTARQTALHCGFRTTSHYQLWVK